VLERTIRKILIQAPAAAEGTCPGPEAVAAYIEGRADRRQRDELEAHFAGCDLCLEEVVLCSEPYSEPAVAPAFQSPVDIIIGFIGDTVKAIRRRTDIRIMEMPDMVPARSGLRKTPAFAMFSRNFGDLSAEVQVEKMDDNTGEIRVVALRENRPADGIRVTLIQDGRELYSSVTEAGRALFEDVEFGRLVVRLGQGGEAIGEIGLSIMAA